MSVSPPERGRFSILPRSLWALMMALGMMSCDRPASPVTGPRASAPRIPTPSGISDSELASNFIAGLEKEPSLHYPWISGNEIVERMTAQGLDSQQVFEGAIDLLRSGTPEWRWKAARFLGKLANQAAADALIEALDDPESSVRVGACYALRSLRVEGPVVEPRLIELCRNDTSIDVRVAAAVALNGANEEVAVSAFITGLESAETGWIRDVCEEELERRGKLALPLPTDIYSEISRAEYEKIAASRRWYTIERMTEKDGVLYFEAVEHPRHVPPFRHWYRTRELDRGQ